MSEPDVGSVQDSCNGPMPLQDSRSVPEHYWWYEMSGESKCKMSNFVINVINRVPADIVLNFNTLMDSDQDYQTQCDSIFQLCYPKRIIDINAFDPESRRAWCEGAIELLIESVHEKLCPSDDSDMDEELCVETYSKYAQQVQDEFCFPSTIMMALHPRVGRDSSIFRAFCEHPLSERFCLSRIYTFLLWW